MQYSFLSQTRADAEHVQAFFVKSQIFPLDGSGHDAKSSEQRHSSSIGSQNAPVFLRSHELMVPHLQTPSVQVSPATLQSDAFWPLHSIS